MNILVLAPQCSSKSGIKLAKGLHAAVLNPFDYDERDFRKHDLVINYGCNRNILYNSILNTPKAVANCINKVETIRIITRAKIPTVRVALSKEEVPPHWQHISIHKTLNGSKGEGVTWVTQKNLHKIEEAAFFSEFFYHKKEFRIVCFQEATYAYEKVQEGTEWSFILREYQYLTPIRKACQEAKKALAIDFVGFDVLVAEDNSFVIIEANSGPIMTEELLEDFKEYVSSLRKRNNE